MTGPAAVAVPGVCRSTFCVVGVLLVRGMFRHVPAGSGMRHMVEAPSDFAQICHTAGSCLLWLLGHIKVC
jgi:hypothetical protein